MDGDEVHRVIHNIAVNTCEYLKDNPKIESLILGVSGGADSALVAMLGNDVCNMMNSARYGHKDIKLIGRSMPILTNSHGEMSRAKAIGETICHDFKIVNLETSYAAISNQCLDEHSRHTIEGENAHAIRMGNIKARTRMIYLYHLASLNNGMVLSTDNFTEYLLGFWTLHGDVGDFGMIQNLWKTEVFMLLDYYYENFKHNDRHAMARALNACRHATPTDGLGITDSDLEQFGGINSYEEVDKIFIEKFNEGYGRFIQNGEIPKVLTMFENTKYKRENPFNIPRGYMFTKVIL